MLKTNVFVLVSFNWPKGCYKRNFVATLALSCGYDLGQKNRLQNGLVMSTDLYHSSAYAFPHYDLRLSTYVNRSNGTLDVMVIGMDNLRALVQTMSAYDITLWQDGPRVGLRVRQLLYRFQYKRYPGYPPVNGSPWTLMNEHPRVLEIAQCFHDHWWDFDNIRIVRVSNAMQGNRVYLEDGYGRSAVDITKILKESYNQGHTCWQHLHMKAARLRILRVKNTIRSTFAALCQRQRAKY